MSKLILIELKKIFSKRSILVMMIIMFLFNLLNNILFYTDYDSDGNYKYLEKENIEEEKKLLTKELDKYDYQNNNDKTMYIELKTKLDILNLKEKYKSDSWQYNKVSDYLYNVVKGINIYTYQIDDEFIKNKYQVELDNYLKKFDSNDWKYFVNLEIKELEKELNDLEIELNLVLDKIGKQKISKLKEEKTKKLDELRYRLDNNVSYDNSYLNVVLNNYNDNIENIKYYNMRIDNLTYKEKIEYQEIKEDLEISKYILDNKKNYNKQNNLNYQLRTIVDDYEIFIIIIILIVASTIMADEFTSGTIKLLLIKPYSRVKILLSKYFTGIIVMMFIISYLILLQLLIGGVIFGFSSLDIPVIVYDFNKESIVSYNVFIYMLIRIIMKLPLIVMIYTISFSIGTIFSSVSISVVIPLFIYMFSDGIEHLVVHYNIWWLKYFINVNWNFKEYLFGRKAFIMGLNFKFSLVVWISYFIVIMLVTIISFKNKNIRNI